MFDYKNKPIFVSSMPFNNGELLILSPDVIAGCGVDSEHHIYFIVKGMPDKKYYAVEKDVDLILESCKYMYRNHKNDFDYETIRKYFMSIMNR